MSGENKRKKITFAVIGLALVIVLSLVTYFVTQTFAPERSVASFCSEATAHKASFKRGSSHKDRLGAFTKLNAVAPSEISTETERIKTGYEEIVAEPSRTVEAEMGIASSQVKVSDYISKNCPNF